MMKERPLTSLSETERADAIRRVMKTIYALGGLGFIAALFGLAGTVHWITTTDDSLDQVPFKVLMYMGIGAVVTAGSIFVIIKLAKPKGAPPAQPRG